jgi:ectoine hydroxylase-related dioxygenase (phytanoyl-CoA dioxygenase family)
MSSPASHVTSEIAEKYERDGYFVLNDVGVSADVVDSIVADLAGEYSDGERVIHDGVVYEPTRIQDAWRFDEDVRSVARSPKVMTLLQELYGRAPLPFQTLNFHIGTQQPAHADALHFNSMPAGFMCGVWLALEDIDMDNGPLVYYPGSHKLPEIRMKDIGAEARGEDYHMYESYVQELIAREGLEPEYGTIRKGQALVWSSNLLHGGAVQKDMTRTRHSQVTHYFFEDCKYYTPMLTTDSDTHWRDPVWVTAR